MVSSHLIPLVIAGSTGCGKSKLALELAQKHQGEIICADSRQFYAHMIIGTASPSESDRKTVPHHGFNIVDPALKKIDAGFFIEFSKKAIASCQQRGKRPILVGGTGLYLRALCYGLSDVPPSNKDLVATLEQAANNQGLQHLYEELISADPSSASIIKASDRYRIIRALEIFKQTGIAPSKLRQSFAHKKAQISAHWALKYIDRSSLELKLKDRIAHMIKNGLIDEALSLRQRLPLDHWALKVMGYEEALSHADGHLDKDEMLERILIRHRQYAKRQQTWFKNEHFYQWKI